MIVLDARDMADRTAPTPGTQLAQFYGDWSVFTDDSVRQFQLSQDLADLVVDPVDVQSVCEQSDARNVPLLFDHEKTRWAVDDATALAGQVAWMRGFLQHFRLRQPGARIGLYAELPQRHYWVPIYNLWLSRNDVWAQANRASIERQRDAWYHANAALAALAPLVDLICASLYLFYEGVSLDLLEAYVRENVAQARQYKKPVWGVIWPRWHRSANPEEQRLLPIPMEYWTSYVDLVCGQVDGLILWDYSGYGGGWRQVKKHFSAAAKIASQY